MNGISGGYQTTTNKTVKMVGFDETARSGDQFLGDQNADSNFEDDDIEEERGYEYVVFMQGST